MRRRALTLVISAAVAAAAIAVGTVASAAPSSGLNDWNCRPSAAHPHPVVLLHGMTSDGEKNWLVHGPFIANAGYCVFALTYGAVGTAGGLGNLQDSGKEIAVYIDRVLTTTGAAKVDLVGHSEGGFLGLYVPKVLKYYPKVGRSIGLGSTTHDTSRQFYDGLGLGMLNPPPDASNPWAQLNDGKPIAQPGIAYTEIATKFDTFVVPADSSFVQEPGVKNVWVQDPCPVDTVGHVGLASDGGVSQMIVNALDPTTAKPIPCATGLPF